MSGKDLSSYDLWNSWRDFNQTGVDQSKGDSSVLTEDAREPESRTLAEKDSAIVAEIGQLAPEDRARVNALNYKDEDRGDDTDIADTTQELTQLYNYLISKGVSKEEATEMVVNVLNMLPEAARAGATVNNLLEACGCNGGHDEHSAVSIPDMGRDFNYDESHSDEGVQARDQLLVINYLSEMLMNTLHDEDELPAWVQTYITEAELLIQKTFKYLVPHMQRVGTEEARTAAQGGDDANVVVVTQNESTAPAPMKSRASASVKSAVENARKTGKMSTVSLSDIFDD
jgi:hypothetical protein